MKLRELFQELTEVQKELGIAPVLICGGTARDKYMDKLENISDVDLTNGEKTMDYLSQELVIQLRKKYNVTRKIHKDHSTIFVGKLKLDFSSNFMVPNIDAILAKLGVTNPTDLQREMYSRDFTCNSLLLTLDLKQILDPTKRGGQDIDAKKVKTCLAPEITLVSYKNRVIRAIYLACKLGFDIDDSIIEYVLKNPASAKIATEKTVIDKLNAAFDKDADRASYYLTKMNIWNQVPIIEKAAPYYNQSLKNTTKLAYYQGGGGVNEPTPGKPKYDVDPAIVVQPHFEEPFYYNYDYLDTEGIDGQPQYGPGSGWAHMNEFKSIKDFLDFRRKRLKNKYVADDSYIDDSSANYKERVDKMKIRASLLSKIIKTAKKEEPETVPVIEPDNNCFFYAAIIAALNPKLKLMKGRHTGQHKEDTAHFWVESEDGKITDPTASQYKEGHVEDGKQIDVRKNIDAITGHKLFSSLPEKYQKRIKALSKDENDGPNFDYGSGLYMNMDKYKSIKDFEKNKPKGQGAFYNDDNNIDFPVDIQSDTTAESQAGPILGDSETYLKPAVIGPSVDGNPNDGIIPGSVGLGDFTTYPQSNQLSGFMDSSLPQNDFEGKPPTELDFGRDYTEDVEFPGTLNEDDLESLEHKYLTPSETDLFGLPDGIDPISDEDADVTVNNKNTYYGTPDTGRQMYEDKWNI
jgi:hypothetical protein